MIDLHVHSSKSDGTLTPTQLVSHAVNMGVSAFALTDHDSIDGINEALQAAEGQPVTVIPGIEFSTSYGEKDIHILGLNITHQTPAFASALDAFVHSRIERNIKMCKKLQDYAGIDITYEKLQAENPGAVLTRAHYGKYLMAHGYIKSISEAFERYIGDHCPCYIPREKVTPEQAIELIISSKGIPVLAHPTLYHMSDEKLNQLIIQLKEAGLAGIEAYYSTYTAGEQRQILSLAKQYELLLSGGSDFHGSNKPHIELGIGKGKLNVPDELLTNLLGWQKLKYN